jgi:hypothetical protein
MVKGGAGERIPPAPPPGQSDEPEQLALLGEPRRRELFG